RICFKQGAHLDSRYGLLKAARKSGKLNLSSLSPAISEMKNSRMLDCSRNQTESIPPVLTQMESLEQLYLRHNKLRFLSRTELHCGNNQIEVLEADHLKHLSALSFLDLPCGLGTLPKLKSLILEANPLRTILSALQKGTGELLKYLRSRKQEQPDGSLKEEPKTATTLPSQAKINVHAIKTLKTQDYRLKKIIIKGSIPDEVFDATLNRLCTLDLSNNDILQVPPELGDCTSLR
uniref:Leucine rich repeat containing 40 n=1 Tax=Cyprinus carpio carpio TaxID=630221 RepID=A0A9J7WZP9_CYPCA